MKVKKYHSYKLCITNQSGKEYIKLNGNVNQTSYATMIKYYHKTKEKYQNEDCTIELVGVHEDGTIGGVIYSKTFCKEVIEEDKELLRPVDDIVSEIQDLLDLLERKKEYHVEIQSASDKKINVIRHQVLSISKFKGSKEELVEEKLRLFDNLEQAEIERKWHKDEVFKLRSLNKRIDIHNLSEQFNSIEIPITKEYDYLSDEKVEEFKIMKEIPYRNDKERLNTIKMLGNKYEKVVTDSCNKRLICYNKAK